jgi:hypothetical protein
MEMDPSTRECGADRQSGVSKFWYSIASPLHGRSKKTLTVKRDAVGRLWLVFCRENLFGDLVDGEASTGKSGASTTTQRFLTDGLKGAYSNPEFSGLGLEKKSPNSRGKEEAKARARSKAPKHYKCARPEVSRQQHAHIIR